MIRRKRFVCLFSFEKENLTMFKENVFQIFLNSMPSALEKAFNHIRRKKKAIEIKVFKTLS